MMKFERSSKKIALVLDTRLFRANARLNSCVHSISA